MISLILLNCVGCFALKQIGLCYDLRREVAIRLFSKYCDVKYETVVCDGNWVDLNQVRNPIMIDFTNFQNITEISFAHAGIDPLDYFGLRHHVPNLRYLDLFGNETSRTLCPDCDQGVTLYLNRAIIWNFGLHHVAFSFERTRDIRSLEGMMNRTKAIQNANEIGEMVFVYDGKHVCPAKTHKFVNRLGTRFLLLQDCQVLCPANHPTYWVYPRDGKICLEMIGRLKEVTPAGKVISLEDEEFNFSK